MEFVSKIQPKDIVNINNINYIVKGINSYGKYIQVFYSKNKIFNFNINLVKSYFNNNTFIWKY